MSRFVASVDGPRMPTMKKLNKLYPVLSLIYVACTNDYH